MNSATPGNGQGPSHSGRPEGMGGEVSYQNLFLAPSDEELMALSELLNNQHWRAVMGWLQKVHQVNNDTISHQWMNSNMTTFLSGGSIMLKTLMGYMMNPGNVLMARQQQAQAMRELRDAGRASLE